MTSPFTGLATDELQRRLAAATDPRESAELERELDRRVTAELLGEAQPPPPSQWTAPPPPTRQASPPRAAPRPSPPPDPSPPRPAPPSAVGPQPPRPNETEPRPRRGGRVLATVVAGAVVIAGGYAVVQALPSSDDTGYTGGYSTSGGSGSSGGGTSGGSAQAGSGVSGTATVSWSIGAERYTAQLSVNTTSGIADVTVENSAAGTYSIREDLTYDPASGAYVGSGVRDARSGQTISSAYYEPDAFVVGPGMAGTRTIVQVCGSTACWPAVTVPTG